MILAKSKPILFKPEMVRAIIDGRKTQTRRVLDPQPECIYDGMYCDKYNKNENRWTFWTNDHKMCLFEGGIKGTAHWKPKYNTGDVLYVRETYCIGTYEEDEMYKEYWNIGQYSDSKTVFYKADTLDGRYADPDNETKWKSPIFMPKKYARIFLRVTNVRVQRLQDITYEEICKEGFRPAYRTMGEDRQNAYDWWKDLWNSIAKECCKWEKNPYVFVYEFERIREA